MLYITKIKNKTFTFQKLVNDFKKELLKSLMLKASKVVVKGAFNPSFVDINNTKQS
jgi:hypothetical protein